DGSALQKFGAQMEPSVLECVRGASCVARPTLRCIRSPTRCAGCRRLSSIVKYHWQHDVTSGGENMTRIRTVVAIAVLVAAPPAMAGSSSQSRNMVAQMLDVMPGTSIEYCSSRV